MDLGRRGHRPGPGSGAGYPAKLARGWCRRMQPNRKARLRRLSSVALVDPPCRCWIPWVTLSSRW
jgi:hypothetical protein